MKLFRPAAPRSAAHNVLRTLLQTVCFWAALLWIVPQGIVRAADRLALPTFPEQLLAGWTVFVVASLGGLWSGFTMARSGQGTPLPFDTARRLVISGPYRFVRNPMAVTGLSQGVGVGLILGSWAVLLYVLAGALLWHFLVRPPEEADLLDRFGSDYGDYRQRVRLWIPRSPHDPTGAGPAG